MTAAERGPPRSSSTATATGSGAGRGLAGSRRRSYPDEGSPRAERGRILARTGHVRSVSVAEGRDHGSRDRLGRCRLPGRARCRSRRATRLGGRDRVAARPHALRGCRGRARAVAPARARDDRRLGRAPDPSEPVRFDARAPVPTPIAARPASTSLRSPTSSPTRSTAIRRCCSSGAAARPAPTTRRRRRGPGAAGGRSLGSRATPRPRRRARAPCRLGAQAPRSERPRRRRHRPPRRPRARVRGIRRRMRAREA